MWMITLVALLLASAASEDPWLVVPGARVGSITAETRRGDLAHLFGARNVKDSMEGPGGDSEAEMATLVYSARPDEELTIFWVGTTPDQSAVPPDSRIDAVSLCAGVESGKRALSCKWHLPGGIRIGTTLKDLEAMNGRPFSLYGFGWDFEGTVSDWKGVASLRVCQTGCFVPSQTFAVRRDYRLGENRWKNMPAAKKITAIASEVRARAREPRWSTRAASSHQTTEPTNQMM